jgi:Protein of unknown function (DUF3750)
VNGHAQMNLRRRLLNFSIAFVIFVFVLPLCLRAAFLVFHYNTPTAYSYDVERADMSSIGFLPDAASHPTARVLIMSAPMSGRRGQFLSHNWVVLKRENSTKWSRYEVLGFASRDASGARNGAWLGNRPTVDRYAPDGLWFGRRPVVIADVEGVKATEIIEKIEPVIDNYERDSPHYRFWPGPNSNTFVQVVLRAAPELQATLPPTAIGKDFRPGIFLGLTDSRTGFEAGLWGVLGLKIGWIEGVEVNLLSFIGGVDVRQPALKLPGFGLIDATRIFAIRKRTSLERT